LTPVFLGALSWLGFIGSDPAPGLFHDRDTARSLECERYPSRVAARTRPGDVLPPGPEAVSEGDALLCRQRLIRPGVRHARDEAVLRDLRTHVSGVASQVASLRADLVDRTWLVEAFYPDADVGTKITFALKTALMRESLRVSDRLPLLSPTDIEIITRMKPSDAYPLACRRWSDTGQLRDTDVLVAQITRDLRETNLHTGLCIDGEWTWLR